MSSVCLNICLFFSFYTESWTPADFRLHWIRIPFLLGFKTALAVVRSWGGLTLHRLLGSFQTGSSLTWISNPASTNLHLQDLISEHLQACFLIYKVMMIIARNQSLPRGRFAKFKCGKMFVAQCMTPHWFPASLSFSYRRPFFYCSGDICHHFPRC